MTFSSKNYHYQSLDKTKVIISTILHLTLKFPTETIYDLNYSVKQL